jgi:limonene-1,2-epoxide hydrolase
MNSQSEKIHDFNDVFMPHHGWVDEFIEAYNKLNVNNLKSLEEIYHNDIHFQDPLHTVNGRKNLIQYFEKMYTNIIYCHFDITHSFNSENEAALYWDMTYQHPGLNKGKKIIVHGHSRLKVIDRKVIFHRDYFDVGNLIYQHVPLLGGLINWINNRAAK